MLGTMIETGNGATRIEREIDSPQVEYPIEFLRRDACRQRAAAGRMERVLHMVLAMSVQLGHEDIRIPGGMIRCARLVHAKHQGDHGKQDGQQPAAKSDAHFHSSGAPRPFQRNILSLRLNSTRVRPLRGRITQA